MLIFIEEINRIQSKPPLSPQIIASYCRTWSVRVRIPPRGSDRVRSPVQCQFSNNSLPASVLRQHNRGVRPRGFVRDGGGGGVLTSYRRRTPLNKKLSYCWDSARSGRSTYPNRNCQRQHDLCRPEFYLTNSCLISGILYRVWRVMLCQLTRWTVSKPTLDE